MESQGTNNVAGPRSEAALSLPVAAAVCTVGPGRGSPSHVLSGHVREKASVSLSTTVSRLPSSYVRGVSSSSTGGGSGNGQASPSPQATRQSRSELYVSSVQLQLAAKDVDGPVRTSTPLGDWYQMSRSRGSEVLLPGFDKARRRASDVLGPISQGVPGPGQTGKEGVGTEKEIPMSTDAASVISLMSKESKQEKGHRSVTSEHGPRGGQKD
jgi:hypothetical protein